jgi:hypothetical protein
MINLLSRDEQKKIYREYLLRIASLVFSVVGLIGTILILVLIPTYMGLTREIASVEERLHTKQAQMTAEDQGQEDEAKQFMSEIQVLRSSGATSSAVAQIERIIALKPANIALASFQYDISEGKVKLSVRGKADRREDLLLFKSKLETEAGFAGIELPAQTLIKRTDIQFSMDLLSGALKTTRNPNPPASVQNGDQILP